MSCSPDCLDFMEKCYAEEAEKTQVDYKALYEAQLEENKKLKFENENLEAEGNLANEWVEKLTLVEKDLKKEVEELTEYKNGEAARCAKVMDAEIDRRVKYKVEAIIEEKDTIRSFALEMYGLMDCCPYTGNDREDFEYYEKGGKGS